MILKLTIYLLLELGVEISFLIEFVGEKVEK